MPKIHKEFYCADFETTTSAYNENKSKVWLYYIENINENVDNSLGVTIDEFFDFLENLQFNSDVYFHNLNWDGEFLLNYLTDHYIYDKQEVGRWNRALERGHWNNMSDGVSSHYVIQFKSNKNNKRIRFLCSYKQLMSSVSTLMGVFEKEKINYDIVDLPKSINDLTPQQIKYIKDDVKAVIPFMRDLINNYSSKMGLTSSGTAIKLVKENLTTKLWNVYFKNKIKAGILVNGVYQEGEWDYFKKGYLGGYTYLVDGAYKKEYTNIKVFDINSLYPYIMRHKNLPVGYPIYKCKQKCNHLKFMEINLSFKLKKLGVPFIPASSGYAQHIEYLKEGVNHLIYVTDAMWDLIQQWYEIYDYHIINEVHFEGKDDVFADYIDGFQEMKQHAVKGGFEYLFSKLMQNQVYGKMAMSPLRKKYYFRPYDPLLDVKKDVVIYGKKKKSVLDWDWDLSDPSYLPMGLWITSLAKIETIKAANIANNLCQCLKETGAFIYSDTDSIHLSMCNKHFDELYNLIEVHPTKLGAWDNERNSKFGYYVKRKFYLEYDDINDNVKSKNIGTAGITKDLMENFTYKDVIDAINGRPSPYKLIKRNKKKVSGGIILLDKEIKIDKE